MADAVETDLAILGAGPGGYAAAFLAADKGMQVTLIDARSKPGGVCLHEGCIPSKALLHAAHLITTAREADTWGLKFAAPKIDVGALRTKKDAIVQGMAKNLGDLAKRRKVTYIEGRGRFEGSQSLQVEKGPRVRFKNCIVATGSVPARIPALNLDSPRVLDSSSALALDDVPGALLVVGGGYIGLEMGPVYAALGRKVTV